jgi:hypothetical protein
MRSTSKKLFVKFDKMDINNQFLLIDKIVLSDAEETPP